MSNTFNANYTIPTIIVYYPDAAGLKSEFDSTELNNFLAVDDRKNISNTIIDTTFNSSNTATASDFYYIYDNKPYNFEYPIGDINHIKVNSRIKCSNLSVGQRPNIKVGIKLFGQDIKYTDNLNIITSFKNYSWILPKNPNTDVNWVWSNLTSIQTGIIQGDELPNTADMAYCNKRDDGGNYFGISASKNVIFVATSTGLRAYEFDGNTITLLDTVAMEGIYSVHATDTSEYIYLACGWAGLHVYKFENNKFIKITDKKNSGIYWDVWSDGTYIYCACSTCIHVYSFDGSTLTYLDNTMDGGSCHNIYSDGTYIYAASYEPSGERIVAFSFDGNTITYINSSATPCMDIIGDGTYIYVGAGYNGIRAYTFDGIDFTLVTTRSDGGSYNGVWYDGTYIYSVAKSSLGGMRAYTYNGVDFTLIDELKHGITHYKYVCSYDKYVYTTSDDVGLAIYSLFNNVYISQQYLEISYNHEYNISIPIPEEISCNHASNINMLNFWKSTREVYSMNRSHKTLVLRGTDYSDTAVTTMNNIRDISGLNMYIFNDTFKIRSFGCKEISKNPLYFEWILELEYGD